MVVTATLDFEFSMGVGAWPSEDRPAGQRQEPCGDPLLDPPGSLSTLSVSVCLPLTLSLGSAKSTHISAV